MYEVQLRGFLTRNVFNTIYHESSFDKSYIEKLCKVRYLYKQSYVWMMTALNNSFYFFDFTRRNDNLQLPQIFRVYKLIWFQYTIHSLACEPRAIYILCSKELHSLSLSEV